MKNIDKSDSELKDIHKVTQHGLSFFQKVSEINIFQEKDILSELEILAVVMEVNGEHILIVVLCVIYIYIYIYICIYIISIIR